MSATPFQPNFRTLDLNLLRVFDEVMAERSLTRAARNLALTQPAVSNALRRLREALGDELVRRGGAGVEPTPRALALWPSVREALRTVDDPEAGMNIVDLGLVYVVEVGEKSVHVEMTMTTAACPMADMITDNAHRAIASVAPPDAEIGVHLVWDPPWTPDKMTGIARDHFGW